MASADGAGGLAVGDDDVAPFDLDKLPKLEELSSETDFRPFLDARVPMAMRNAALQRMWTLDPTIRDFIEIAEWQWNWNVPGGAPGYEATLPPGTDIAALLAQATGAIDKAIEQAKRDAGEIDDEGAQPIERVGGDSSVLESVPSVAAPAAEPDPVRLSSVVAPALPARGAPSFPANAATHNVAVANSGSTEPRRRRHGGALAD